MNVTRVWNISDHPATKVEARTVTIFGRPCAPGRYVLVSSEQLKNARKIEAEVAAKMLHVGDQPPEDYVRAKSVPRAPFPKGAARAHGKPPVEAISTEAPAVVDTQLKETSGEQEGHRKRRRG